MQFVLKLATEAPAKTRTKNLPDISNSGLEPGEYVTAEALAEEFKIPRELVLRILDHAKVWPIAKVLNREPSADGIGLGLRKDGRPKMAFASAIARGAVESGIEAVYGR
jgi:hypothetical protein